MKRALLLLLSVIIFITCISGCNNNKTEEESVTEETTIVYITKSGKKYHRENCTYLSKSKIEISLDEAQEKGYNRCSKCNPPKE